MTKLIIDKENFMKVYNNPIKNWSLLYDIKQNLQTLTDEEIDIIEYTMLRGRELGKWKQINEIIKKLKGDLNGN
ncbi:MAG: hypothetical protein KKB31_01115 [Nanoarchaeota archaeon]|nr:hypothetical protein [Nanoarchaeota archaeon]